MGSSRSRVPMVVEDGRIQRSAKCSRKRAFKTIGTSETTGTVGTV
jgi:uncharacterized membrane protein